MLDQILLNTKKRSKEWCQKISIAKMGHSVLKETREKISQANKKKWQDSEYRQMMSDKHKGKITPKEVREKMSESRKKIVFDKKRKNQLDEARKKRKFDLDTRIKMSKASKKKWKNKAYRKSMLENNKGLFKKDDKPWNVGKHLLKETKEKISRSLKKSWGEEDWSERNRKVSEALKGRVFSEEHKRHIRENHKGMLGKKVSKETKKKMSLAHKGDKNYWYGKKMTLAQRKVLSKAQTGYKQSEEHIINKNISLLNFFKSKQPTSIEKKVYDELEARHLSFETQKLINGKFLVDAHIPSLNLIIEADGDYWHSLPRVMKKDKAENAYLTKCGYNLLRLSEKEINDGSFKERMVF